MTSKRPSQFDHAAYARQRTKETSERTLESKTDVTLAPDGLIDSLIRKLVGDDYVRSVKSNAK